MSPRSFDLKICMEQNCKFYRNIKVEVQDSLNTYNNKQRLTILLISSGTSSFLLETQNDVNLTSIAPNN